MSFHWRWRWWDQIQAIFLSLFYFNWFKKIIFPLYLGPTGITREQHDKLRAQKQQYLEAKGKLEAQLLKLKEQREALKEDGAVHEDLIMKENAKLQVLNA